MKFDMCFKNINYMKFNGQFPKYAVMFICLMRVVDDGTTKFVVKFFP